MLKKTLVRSAALAATAALAAGMGITALAPAAQAVVTGTASLSPATGNAGSLINITTSAPCAAPATRVKAIASGFGFPGNGQVIVAQTNVGFSTTDPITLPLSDSFFVYAQSNSSTALVGAYDVRVQCVNNLGSVVYDEFQTTMNWTTPGNSFANIDNATYVTAVPSVATSTVLTTSVPSPQDEGTAITLTATVDAGATDPNAGTVEFFDGATSLGTSTVAAGVATKSVTLPSGTRSLTAVFAGASGFDASTSPAVSYVINDVIVATTTTLAVSGSGVQYDAATLDATVVPNNAVGTVQFFDGATQIGTKPLVAGTASLSYSSFGLGAHSLTAKFVPTNANDYSESTSTPAQPYTVVAPSGEQEFITTEIPAGALTISVLGDGAVLLPAALATDGSEYTASGQMDPVRVVDTRAGAIGWTASGQLAPFQQGGSPSIAAANLGWTPSLTSVSNPALVVTPGAVVAPAAHVAIGAGAGTGLSSISTLATSAAGSSVGTAELGALLNLRAPTTTLPGTHTAVLTLTAI